MARANSNALALPKVDSAESFHSVSDLPVLTPVFVVWLRARVQRPLLLTPFFILLIKPCFHLYCLDHLGVDEGFIECDYQAELRCHGLNGIVIERVIMSD